MLLWGVFFFAILPFWDKPCQALSSGSGLGFVMPKPANAQHITMNNMYCHNMNRYPKGELPSFMTCKQTDKDNASHCWSMAFDWVINVDYLLGPIFTFVDYGPTTIKHTCMVRHMNESLHPPLSVMSLQPTPSPAGNLIPLPQPVHVTPKHSVILPKRDMAPHACTLQWMCPPHPWIRWILF